MFEMTYISCCCSYAEYMHPYSLNLNYKPCVIYHLKWMSFRHEF